MKSVQMKLVTRFLTLIAFSATALFYTGCGSDDGDQKSDEQTQLEALSKTWTVTSVKLDDVDRTSDFENESMKLTISGAFATGATYNYSLTGNRPEPSPWPASGTWKFGSDVKSQMIRDPGSENLEMNYSISGNTLTIDFECTTCDFAGGKVSSVNGPWVFVFSGD